MRQRSELAKPPLRASEAEPTVNSSESTALAPIALPSLLSTSREWSCGVPKKHVEQGLLQLRLLAGKQDQRQQVEASRSVQVTGGAAMAPVLTCGHLEVPRPQLW